MGRVVVDARLYDLRHSHASHAAMNGESLHVTGRLLGHRRASTTNRYVHLDVATMSQAAERVALATQRKLRYNKQRKSAILQNSGMVILMAKGNDGNYMQHCIEIEAATRLAKCDANGRLHIALTHGMEPFEKFGGLNNNAHRLLYDALCESSKSPQCNEYERLIVKAYRKTNASEECYPNTAELLREVIGTDKLSGGITESDVNKHKTLADAWSGSRVNVAHSSWRQQLGSDEVLGCPDHLDIPWMFSMDPMTYTETGCKDDNKLHRSDIHLMACTLGRYVGSGQPGIASLFVYNMDAQKNNAQLQFWKFVDDLARQSGMHNCSYWVAHRGGNRNLAALLYSNIELSSGFAPPDLKPGRGTECSGSM